MGILDANFLGRRSCHLLKIKKRDKSGFSFPHQKIMYSGNGEGFFALINGARFSVFQSRYVCVCVCICADQLGRNMFFYYYYEKLCYQMINKNYLLLSGNLLYRESNNLYCRGKIYEVVCKVTLRNVQQIFYHILG